VKAGSVESRQSRKPAMQKAGNAESRQCRKPAKQKASTNKVPKSSLTMNSHGTLAVDSVHNTVGNPKPAKQKASKAESQQSRKPATQKASKAESQQRR